MNPQLELAGLPAHRYRALGLLLSAVMLLVAALALKQTPESYAQGSAGPVYLPVLSSPRPPVPPQFVKNVPLPTAQCPNTAGFNRVSGFMYIVNSFSQNVTVFQNRDYVTDIPTASWPTGISVDPSSARTWVTNLHSGVSLLENTAQVGFVPRDYEPYGVAFNPVNGYAYVSDLDSKVQIINGDQLVTTLRVTDPVTGKGAGWLRAIVVDSQTGLVYVASWDYGKLYVIDGVNVVNSVQLGWGPLNMALDEVRGLLYVAHSEPNAQYPHNISVVDLEKLTVSFVASAPTVRTNSHGVAVDARSGYAYVTNPEAKTVTILQGTTILDNVAVGERPWGVGVNPRDGYVYVTNRGSNDVSVIQRSAVIATIPVQGVQPFAVGVDTTNNDVYIANRGTEPALFECEQGSVTILH